jgi:uncharacterized protein
MKIAVIGSGIAGLSCAWLLSRHAQSAHQVTLFEKNDYLGGHTNTIDITHEGVTHPVDTGFLVFNDWTYPNLIPMLAHLGVETAASDMSFGVKLTNQAGQSEIEWCGSNSLSSVFAQPSNLFKPAFIGMLRDLLRFNKAATALAANNETQALTGTLGQYLLKHGYSQAFRDWYLVPMAACIWSTPTKRIDDFPLATFMTFCANHGLISVNNRPQWRTIKGGARNYVKKIAATLDDVRLNSRITSVTRQNGKVILKSAANDEQFDHVVFACHTDQAIKLLADMDDTTKTILHEIPYQPNTAILHTDASLLPQRRRAWAAWNYHAHYRRNAAENDSPVSLTYLLNKLQPTPFVSPVMVTMNPLTPIAPTKIIKTIQYEHPLFLASSVSAKKALRTIQGKQNTWYAGAWTRYGFHEDGLMSGIAVARALGATTPWPTNTPPANELTAIYPGVDG